MNGSALVDEYHREFPKALGSKTVKDEDKSAHRREVPPYKIFNSKEKLKFDPQSSYQGYFDEIVYQETDGK